MHVTHMDHGPRYLGAVVLTVAIIVLAALCRRQFQRSTQRGLLVVLHGYSILLFALFIVGLLADDGYGVAFIPLMVCSAPWSFLAPGLLHGPIGNWFATGLIGNFVLLVVLCGGMNCILLCLIIRKTFYPVKAPVRQTLL
jgi:hypothetical protein